MNAKKGKLTAYKATGAVADFNAKFTCDMIALLTRSLDIMIIEIGKEEAVNVILSVLAMAGATMAHGADAPRGIFPQYAVIAEQKIYEKDAP